MKENKYLGMIFEGRWKVVDKVFGGNNKVKGYIVENIFNEEQMYVGKNTIIKIGRGETSISHIRKRNAIKTKRDLDIWGHRRVIYD